MKFWHDLVTKKSFEILQDLRRQFKFILIGGWAVFLYTKGLKSKDIDFVCDFEELEKIKNQFGIRKNERLKKYETKIKGVDIDIYAPFYSNPGIPAEKIKNYIQSIEGFLAPKPEILLILKQKASQEREGTTKGEKDKIDIISILKMDLDFDFYFNILKKNKIENFRDDLVNLLENTVEVKELNLNQYQFNRLKKLILMKLKNK
ncbi:MAG: hypothetical protein COX43_01055 [Parcubacteria group bacterium CG23_combo_of_CG06-09_8_20_14_all_35_9]|nr:MAG: hypothetical protein COX43_01055 [Parcubacteria group bacterium CG23_combo_of_CG06-09_8_20_14_all_35_9]